MNTLEICAICLDTIKEERVALEECNHAFWFDSMHFPSLIFL